jgi:predicted lipoprotein
MRRLFTASCLCLFALGCDKPVLDEVVKSRLGESNVNNGFADGSVVRDELDAGLDGSSDEDVVEVVDPEGDVPFSKAGLLKATGDCALSQLEKLRDAAEVLRDVSARWAKDRSDANAASARSAFRAALAQFQRAEGLKIGPVARSSSIGGLNLGDELYTPFPSLDRCGIDRQLVLGAFSAREVAASSPRQRGLSAFEYLTYYVGSDNSCQPANDINANGSWAALGAEEIAQRRADLAAAIAADVLAVCEEALEAWSPSGGNFYGEITKPGGKFRNEQIALNTISNAMFYLEIDVKDVKLGRILNRNGTTCQSVTCPEALEAPLSGLSGQNLSDNLVGFRDVFQGCGAGNRGLGFDDWLAAMNAEGTTERILAGLSEAEAAMAAVPSLEEALASDKARVTRIYDGVKAVTDRLKGELTSLLSLDGPPGIEGDND